MKGGGCGLCGQRAHRGHPRPLSGMCAECHMQFCTKHGRWMADVSQWMCRRCANKHDRGQL